MPAAHRRDPLALGHVLPPRGQRFLDLADRRRVLEDGVIAGPVGEADDVDVRLDDPGDTCSPQVDDTRARTAGGGAVADCLEATVRGSTRMRRWCWPRSWCESGRWSRSSREARATAGAAGAWPNVIVDPAGIVSAVPAAVPINCRREIGSGMIPPGVRWCAYYDRHQRRCEGCEGATVAHRSAKREGGCEGARVRRREGVAAADMIGRFFRDTRYLGVGLHFGLCHRS